jgi:hypothetical protein
MDPAFAQNVNGVVTTFSPGPTPRAIKGSIGASLPEAQATANRVPQ